MKRFSFLFACLIVFSSLFGQIVDPKDRAKIIGTNRTNNRIDQSIDKGFNSVEEGIGNMFKKKDKKPKDSNQSKESNAEEESESSMPAKSAGSNTKAGSEAKPEGLKAYSKFDFVPGEKVVASEDFAQDAVGDFPAKWNTNATAEVVTLSNKPGKWLKIGKVEGSFIPEFVKDIPENSTIEFDLVYNNWLDKYAYQRRLFVALTNVDSPAKNMKDASVGEGALFSFDGGHGKGSVSLNQLGKNGAYTDLHGRKDMDAYINSSKNGKVFKISMWRQKTRLRIYVDEQKVFDMPRIFAPDLKLNELRFFGLISNEGEEVFISNLRVAVGAPDTRNKLITEGKFVTTGITFDVGSANIKPTSYGVLKEIGTALNENPDVKIKIIGHTDSDGDAAKNMELSKNRAEAVKKALAAEFAIDASRMQTDGKGASQPAQPNTTPEGKANNRRVEFIKL
jgi:outer membrane protein OmpA-like peptidoglycan-associated protein